MSDLLANPVVRLYGIVSLLLVLKMVLVGVYTTVLRLRRRVFATPEDYARQNLPPVGVADEDIERVRRAHRNDLENILPFFLVGFLYSLTGPSLFAARCYFFGYLLARCLHSVFYIRAMQPHRTISFSVAAVLNVFMLLTTLSRLLAA
jgi:glutathione S-transferase